MKQLLSDIRTWKNRLFPDWIWDLLVGGVLGTIAMLTQVDLLVLVIPFTVTVINQFYNRLFEPKDFLLRMAMPLIIYIILKLITH
jgi:hypothetical protein